MQGIEQVTKTCQGSISGITSASGKLPKASQGTASSITCNLGATTHLVQVPLIFTQGHFI
jgi:hypothetical protein